MTRAAGRTVRLLRLRERLALGPVGVAQLARDLGVTRRTVERDLVTLRDQLGEALSVDAQHRYALPSGPSALNEVEALATYSAVRLLQHTGVGERHYRASMVKLARSLPEPAQSVLLARVETLQSAADDRVLDLVAQAWFQRRVLRCRYRSANSQEGRLRDLEVYFFELHRRNHEPYVLAFDRTLRQRVLVFKLARMTQVQLLNEGYEMPDDFDPAASLSGSFGIVVGEQVLVTLHCTPLAAQRLAEANDESIRVKGPLPDGRVEVEVGATLDADGNALELIPWVLGWGDGVEVIAPLPVREAVAARLQAAARMYAGDG